MLTGVVLLAKDEETILPEWLAYHRALGFDRIHVFDNESGDASVRAIRQAAARVDGISVETWPSHLPMVERQRQAFERGLDIMRNEGIEWCLFVDADEFITVTIGETLQDFLMRRAQHAAIALHWSFYGSSGHIQEPSGLIIENYLLRARPSFEPQSLCKSLVRVPYVQGCMNSHGFLLDSANFPYVDCHGQPVQWESHGQDHVLDPWRINHYFVRSRDWWDKKVARSNATPGFGRGHHEWDHYDRNEIFDPCAATHGEAVRREMRRMGFEPPPPPDWSDRNLAGVARLIRQSSGWSAGAAFGPPPEGQSRVDSMPFPRLGPVEPAGAEHLSNDRHILNMRHNVALGKRATQSSISPESRRSDIHEEAMGGVDGVISGSCGFRTGEDDRPWWMVDLAAVYAISEIRIFNVLDIPHRARHLSIWTSTSLTDWLHAFTRSEETDFFGADGNPLIVTFFVPPEARFIRIQLPGRSHLHLDEVQVFGSLALRN